MGFQEIENLLKEEQWTRTTVQTYTVNSFQTLDGQIKELDEEQKTEVKNLCDKHLAERERNSIIAMYLSGSIQLERKGADDYLQLLNLIEMFMENKKWNVVEMLCNKILSRSENKHALRLLSSCYEQTGRRMRSSPCGNDWSRSIMRRWTSSAPCRACEPEGIQGQGDWVLQESRASLDKAQGRFFNPQSVSRHARA